MARCLKFRIYEVEGFYYPSSENKDADQLRGHREADLRLCFRICKTAVFSFRGSYVVLQQVIIPDERVVTQKMRCVYDNNLQAFTSSVCSKV